MRTTKLVTQPTIMRAAALLGKRRIGLIRLPRPAPGRGEALIRIRAVGICRSDLHYYEHGRIGSQVITKFPQVLGHEPAGEIVRLGPGVRGFKIGDRVAVEPAVPCGRCAECLRGRSNICGKVRFLGMPGQPGALAEYLVMPADNLVKVGRRVSFAQAAALEPMAIGLHAVGLLGNSLGRAVTVIGAGPIGLCVLAALRLQRVRVTICDYLPARLTVARRMGAARVVRIHPRRPMALQTGRLTAPVVVEAGGTPEAMDLAIRAAGPGGTVAFIGIPDGEAFAYPVHVARRKELTVINVRRSNGELAQAARLVASGRLRLQPMLTHQGPLSAAGRFFELVSRKSAGVVKAVVEP